MVKSSQLIKWSVIGMVIWLSDNLSSIISKVDSDFPKPDKFFMKAAAKDDTIGWNLAVNFRNFKISVSKENIFSLIKTIENLIFSSLLESLFGLAQRLVQMQVGSE